MSETISVTLTVQVAGGPRVNIAQGIEVDAYTKIDVEIANDSADVAVNVQPGGAGDVKLLLISSDLYGAGLTYSVDGGATTIPLDQPHLFLGSGGAQVSTAPQSVVFNNSMAGGNANVTILVGRNVT